MDKKSHRLLQLSEPVFDSICQYLGPADIKSLSLTSHGLMSAIENVQKWAPRLHLITADSTCQYQKATRMIPEVYPGSYLVDRRKSFDDHKQQEIIAITCSPSSPPTYNEAHLANWSSALRFQSRSYPDRWKARVWLCPHVGCKFEDIKIMTQQQEPPVSVCDTTSMLCPFPKCSLWTRSAISTTRTTPATYEMCSTIRIYRRRCSSLNGVKHMLTSRRVRHHLIRATGRLSLQMCSHLNISSPQVLAGINLDQILLLHASQHYIDIDLVPSLQQALDQQCCQNCSMAGTYTTWGFLARYTRDSNAVWVDIEMMLCRPLFDCGEQDEYTSKHWLSHSCSGYDIVPYSIMWEFWARIVAETGFDWRTPLPAAFLRQPCRGLLDFPSRS